MRLSVLRQAESLDRERKYVLEAQAKLREAGEAKAIELGRVSLTAHLLGSECMAELRDALAGALAGRAEALKARIEALGVEVD